MPVTVGLEEGVRSAISQVNPMMARLQGMVNQKPITLRVDVNGVKQSISKVLKDPKVDAKTLEKILIDLETRINKLAKTSRANTAKGQADLQRLSAGYGAINAKLQMLNQPINPMDKLANSTFKSATAFNSAAKASNRLNSSLGIQEGYVGRLLARTLIYTGLFRAVSMIKNVRDITAEFELQEVALGAIIQDTERASQLFSELKVQALKSPFQIKDLVSYTKQLAAYRIETENLFDTTKRLADISAGLGVDMQRLILAYGQVRAASVLRGQELRQFTEAGVPLVEELAKKFSKLRGQMVSTSEVFELISQRAVPFSMIKEIFEDMTNAGGVFYEMQLKQSETLKGQWSNLKDAISLMYDEMGNTRSVRRGIEGVYKLIRNLASNWRDVGRSITGVVSLLGVYSAIMPRLGASTKVLTAAQNAHNRAVQAELALGAKSNALGLATIKQLKLKAFYLIKAAYATNVFGKAWYRLAASFLGGGGVKLAVAVVGLLVAKLASAAIEANRLNRELSKISSDAENRTAYLQRNFIRLANVATDSSKSAKEQQEAVAELQRTYSDIIPSQDLEIKKLIDLKGNYESVTRAIRDKVSAQMLEQQMNKVEEDFGQKLAEQRNKAIQRLMSNFNLQKEEARRVLDDIEKANRAGESFLSGYQAIFNALRRQGIDTSSLSVKDATVNSVFRYIKTMDDLDEKIIEVQEDAKDTMSELGQYAPRWKKAFEEIGNIVPSDKTYEAGKTAVAQKLAAMRDFIIEILKEETDQIDRYIKGNQIDFKAIAESAEDLSPQLRTLAIRVQKEYENLQPTDRFKNVVTTAFENITKSVGIDMDKFVAYLDTGTDGIQSYVDNFAKSVKDYQQTTREMLANNEKIRSGEKGTGALVSMLYTDEEIDRQQKATTVMEQMLEFLRDYVLAIKGEKAPTDNRLANLNEEVSLLEKVYRKYKEYAKVMTDTQAKQKTMHYFEDTIKDLRFGAAFDAKEFSEILKKYQDEARKLPKSDKAVMEIGFKADDALWEQEQERIERRLKDLSDKISQSQTAKNFFNDILARTGDRQLAADMTISVYGEVGEDLKQNMIDQVRDAFAGVDVTSAINMDTLTINYRQLADIYSKNQDKILEKNRQTAKQLVDNGLRASADQIKAWYQEVEKAKTFAAQRVELARRTAERIREINESNIPETEKQQLTRAYKAKEDKEAQRLAYEAFKNSPMYVQLFENLDNASTQMLTNMKKRLSDIKSEWKNLEPEQVKELTRRMQELDKQLAKRNPFKVLGDAIREVNDLGGLRAYNNAMDEAEKAERRRERSVEALEIALDNLRAAQKMYYIAVKKHGADSVEAVAAEQNLKNAQDRVNTIKEQAEVTKTASDNAQELLGKWKDIFSNISAALAALSDFVNKFRSISESTTNLLSAIGVDEDTVGHISSELNSLFDVMDSASKISEGITKVISGGNIFEGITDIVTGLIDTIASVWDAVTGGTIFKANREIERQQKLLDNLEDSYSRLEKAQAKAFSTEYIQNYSQQLSNLQAQQAAYEAQAEAEKSKGKKSDEEKVAEYERAALDAQDQMVELKDSFLEKMAGTTLTSAAQEFAEAWIEAYKEFGSVTSAMSDKFNEMIQNMIVQSLAAKVMESILSPLFTQIDELAKDSELSAEDIALISKQVPDYINLINSGMQNMVNELGAAGLNLRTTGQGLTGISKDIANASEESILGLASGINTQNFYISQIHANVAQILLLMQGNGAQIAQQAAAGTALQVDNPYITQYLPSIDQHTANIESYCAQTLDALNKVIKPSGSKGSHWVVTS